jgi:phosphoribosylanthranilate isomerase
MMVKICGITNRADALAAADAGASALGFNFYPGSPRYVRPEVAQAILADLDRNVMKVGVFVNEPATHIVALAERLALDVVQLHGEAAEFPAGLRVWRAVRVTPGFSIAGLDAIPAEACLLDTPAADLYGGTGRTFDWSVTRGAGVRVILAGGLDESNVREAIEAAHPWGVDACSRLESAPGRKDHGKMARFLKAALS